MGLSVWPSIWPAWRPSQLTSWFLTVLRIAEMDNYVNYGDQVLLYHGLERRMLTRQCIR